MVQLRVVSVEAQGPGGTVAAAVRRHGNPTEDIEFRVIRKTFLELFLKTRVMTRTCR
jgi:hypothetical protein